MPGYEVGYLEKTFIDLVHRSPGDKLHAINYWAEIESQYTSKNRFYHNLQHLENLLAELDQIEASIENRDIILFSLFYHDFIYDPTRSDNEKRSAAWAIKRARELQLPEQHCQKIEQQILATKFHEYTGDQDTDLFTDADLAILGADPQAYLIYAQQIRKEYAFYPDSIFNQGRAKLLQHLLDRENIYNTIFFQSKFEKKARLNLANELLILK